ncbi:DUF885 family protein [Streptomyces roseoverticillatus]|uniref:DUF885 family protein n=1 Tax=Streptomyces roseoverticillatus TaxID=66429 RepID=A0ABV3IVG4_9ACTN
MITSQDARLRAVTDLMVPATRTDAGRHEYDGLLQDLSPDGVRRGLAALGGSPVADPHDERQLSAFEHALWVRYGELELHRFDPTPHLENLDVTCYDREYAPAAERAAARRTHLAGWPDAVDAAIAALDRVPAPLAETALDTARGLTHLVTDEPPARAALGRLTTHLRHAARTGDPDPALGESALARLAGATEAVEVDLTALAARLDAERDAWRDRLIEACGRIDPAVPAEVTMAGILADHPSPSGVLELAVELVAEVETWTAERGLVPYLDGECRVGVTPPTDAHQVATLTMAAPYEPDGPSWFRITPPAPDWPADRSAQWLSLYNRSGLANIALHEAAPGHHAHGRALRRAAGDVRRTLHSAAFVEGWAHYCEQLAVEEGFRDGDPRFAASVARDALLRITRLACTIGFQARTMPVAEARHRYTVDALLAGPAADAAVHRVLREPLTMSYTWGKLAILDLRDRARAEWGSGFSLGRFHAALLGLGAPPLGLLDRALGA